MALEDMTPDRMVHSIDSLVFAAGDAHRLDVVRSVVVRPDDAGMAPVRRFIADHGLVLAFSGAFENRLMMFGESVMDTYVSAGVRREAGGSDDWPDRVGLDSFSDDDVRVLRLWAEAVIAAAR